MKHSPKPVLLTVRHDPDRTRAPRAIELPDGTPIAGVASAVIDIDDHGLPVLTIQLRRFGVDVADDDPAPYPWQDLGVLALPRPGS